MFNAATIKEDIYAQFIEKCQNSSTEELNSFLNIIFKDSKLRPSSIKSYLKTWVEELNLVPSSYNNLVISVAVKLGIVKIVQELLPNMITTPKIIFLDILFLAIENGHTEIVEILLKDKRIKTSQKEVALNKAIGFGHIEIIKILLDDLRNELATDAGFANYVFGFSVKGGQKEIIKILLNWENVNPAFENNQAIIDAASSGHTGVVQILLEDERVDPSAQDNMALESAVQNGHLDIVKLLIDRPNINAKLDYEKLIALSLKYERNEGRNKTYVWLEANNKANHGFITFLHNNSKGFTLNTSDSNDTVSLPPEVVKEHIIKRYFSDKRQ